MPAMWRHLMLWASNESRLCNLLARWAPWYHKSINPCVSAVSEYKKNYKTNLTPQSEEAMNVLLNATKLEAATNILFCMIFVRSYKRRIINIYNFNIYNRNVYNYNNRKIFRFSYSALILSTLLHRATV